MLSPMDTRSLIASLSVAGLAVLGGSLYIGARLAAANHRPPTAAVEGPSPPPAAPELDPAYAAGSIKIAAEMGVTVAELRRRYQEGADACGTTPEAFWGEHVRAMRRWEATEALEMEIKLCQMRRQ